MTFINEGSVQIGTNPADATLKDNSDYLWTFHELLLTGSKAVARNPLHGGGKHIRFLPNINKLSIEIAGQEYPGCSTFDNIGNNPQRAYKFYKECFQDEQLVPLRDWMFRFFKLRFDYRGQLGLFDKAA